MIKNILLPLFLVFIFSSDSFALEKKFNPFTKRLDYIGTQSLTDIEDNSGTCSAGEVLEFNGTDFVCAADDTSAGGGSIVVSEDGTFVVSADTVNFTTGLKATAAGTKVTVSGDIATLTTPGIASFDTTNFTVGAFGGASIKAAGIQDDEIAAGAVDGGTAGEIADDSVTAADLATDSVGSAELNATDVEAELEAVLDLDELQGTLDVASGGTGLGTVSNDSLLVGNNAGTGYDQPALPNCGDSGGNHLNYVAATGNFVCGTSGDGVGGAGGGGFSIRVSEDGTFVQDNETRDTSINFTTGLKATSASSSDVVVVSGDMATSTTPGIASFDATQFSVGPFGGVTIGTVATAGGWTDTGTLVRETASTDEVLVGGINQAFGAQFTISGIASKEQLLVRGNSSQTRKIMIIENSVSSDVFAVSNDGTITTTLTPSRCVQTDASGNLTSSAAACDTSADPWVTNSNVVNLATDTDNVTIGSATAGGKLFIDGDADEIQLQVQGNATQTASLVTYENSVGTDVFTISNTGVLVAGASAGSGQSLIDAGLNINVLGGATSADDFVVEGDTDTDLLTCDASADKCGVSIAQGSQTALFHIDASSTARASLRVAAGAAPTSPNEGDVWNDSTQEAIQSFLSGIKQTHPGIIFTATADATHGNSLVETTIVGTGVGTLTLPANFFTVGKTLRFNFRGFKSSDSATPGTLTIALKLGGTTIETTTLTIAAGGTANLGWEADYVTTCRTTGGTGTVYTQGIFVHQSSTSGLVNPLVETATVTVDTTTSLAIDLTADWSVADADNTMTTTNINAEVLN